MKLWNNNSTSNLDKVVEKFTVGKDKEYDMRIAKYDIQASTAHAKMLFSIGLLTEDEKSSLITGLSSIELLIEKNEYKISEGMEDIHSQIEFTLTQKIGEAGKKIHMGRSRNDQVLVALQLYYKDKIKSIQKSTIEIIDLLLNRAKNEGDILMPGYTHSQIGMVSSFGLWLAGYAESLVQDANQLTCVNDLIDQNPLGSAAGYGNSFPLDREITTQLLEFKGTAINPIFAQLMRGKSELLICQSFSNIALTLNKFASDVILFVNGNYGFFSLPDSITTGSSIMPHKKNPDVFELVRAKCNQLISTPNQVHLLINNLTSGYHRDFQSLKEIIFPAIDTIKEILEMLILTIPLIEIKKSIIDDSKYDNLFTVEKVNDLVLSGLPFREAYHTVSEQVKNGSFVSDRNINHTHIGSIGNLGLEEIRRKLL